MHNPWHPPPAPAAFGEGKVVAEVHASPLSKLVFSWLAPFLSVGFSRPLEKEGTFPPPLIFSGMYAMY
jgi:ATP-binding cassette, subfamily C (CFTR/MRP), member 1